MLLVFIAVGTTLAGVVCLWTIASAWWNGRRVFEVSGAAAPPEPPSSPGAATSPGPSFVDAELTDAAHGEGISVEVEEEGLEDLRHAVEAGEEREIKLSVRPEPPVAA